MPLQGQELLKEGVVLRVGQLGGIEDVIAMGVVGNLLPQPGETLMDTFVIHEILSLSAKAAGERQRGEGL